MAAASPSSSSRRSRGKRSRVAERRHPSQQALERIRERLAHAENGWFFAQIAGQVAKRRKELGLSQAELGALCGTTQSAIARLEGGGRPPRIDTLLRIAGALDCDLAVELRPRER
ncbi:MAG: helix-turn-helix transcriptional regulator [Thermoleophilia bacterium]|nr:helix-turn-helix transcriptional regulator [Thermoleophilia bacterium]